MANPSEISRVLSEFPELTLALLFGSVAKGTEGPESDLDIAVMADAPLPAERKIEIIRRLAESFGRTVDLIDLKVAGLPIMGQAIQGQRLLGDDTVFGNLLSRYLIDAADFMPLRERILSERRKAWINS